MGKQRGTPRTQMVNTSYYFKTSMDNWPNVPVDLGHDLTYSSDTLNGVFES